MLVESAGLDETKRRRWLDRRFASRDDHSIGAFLSVTASLQLVTKQVF
jgi:hypothetical protein